MVGPDLHRVELDLDMVRLDLDVVDHVGELPEEFLALYLDVGDLGVLLEMFLVLYLDVGELGALLEGSLVLHLDVGGLMGWVDWLLNLGMEVMKAIHRSAQKCEILQRLPTWRRTWARGTRGWCLPGP